MDNFSFYNPTRIEFGSDKEKLIGQILAEHNVKNVLLAYGSERIKHDGLFVTISQSLTQHGIRYVEFGGIVSNPLLSKVREGIQAAREHQVDAVLSVGGGSVLDSAKSIAAGTLYEGDVWDLFIGKGQIHAALPVFSIMTLAATGSEMNSGAVITNDVTREKFALHSVHTFPKVSVVNPALMQTVSRDYLVYSAADIIAHSIEGYFTAAVQPKIQSRLVESVIATVLETTELLLKDPGDYNARAEFAWASTLALNGLTYAGTSGFSYPNHMIEHSLSALFNVPHGAGLSVVMPAWMKWYHSQNPAQFARFTRTLFGKETAEEGIAALETWFDKIGTPTRLSQLGITEADMPAILENLKGNTRWFGLAETYTQETLTTILKLAL
ncbi:MAG TPA: NADH-dependent alcohol dehydrogenase [Salmonella bongori]|uniref:NADH-dependent alcohol dehydrogenase n=3 Tax=Salmonella bongori TaxID=54736 RepID=A0A248K7M7_SALBN|nr:iron-containing alcohol dehydrogenase [Salmonella bongori]ASG54289.1 NADH-dependent alcohol dehydrogenase [Salmonella bongori serovar 66:z41:- str. SA19983605]ECC9754093.1 iron-containing alcohol dehydrogenase [Salmonella bongori]EDP8564602.1 iron-containing alcohol dehydrogenase [Salmonella bongori]EDP8608465.1 iron-containing alcohol dehydrogenase [Salmonella bongori]EDP8648549.1 iron-containing alcohol dehydrogenase [Salmonella bongori]